VTYTQGGWGSTPAGNNPGKFLQDNFTILYGATGGVTVGKKTGAPYAVTPNFLKLTSAMKVEIFLPAGGKPSNLIRNYTDEASTSAGVFGGQVLALEISVDFSNAGKTRSGLASRRLASGRARARRSARCRLPTVSSGRSAKRVAAYAPNLTIADLNEDRHEDQRELATRTVDHHYPVPRVMDREPKDPRSTRHE
jgi:hypothetical protein